MTHAICAIGIYWGRFCRFNSWDLVTQPDALLTRGIDLILGKQPLFRNYDHFCGSLWVILGDETSQFGFSSSTTPIDLV